MGLNRGWAIKISGMIWFGVGLMLMIKGLKFVVMAGMGEGNRPLLTMLGGGEQATFIVIVSGLFIGFLKGKFVLVRSAKRIIAYILSLPEKTTWKKVYPPRYYILIGVMMFLGFILRYVPVDVRGLIDIAIGSALINGAMTYLRMSIPAKV